MSTQTWVLYTGLFLELSFSKSGGVQDNYTFQCGLVGSFTYPGIDTIYGTMYMRLRNGGTSMQCACGRWTKWWRHVISKKTTWPAIQLYYIDQWCALHRRSAITQAHVHCFIALPRKRDVTRPRCGKETSELHVEQSNGGTLTANQTMTEDTPYDTPHAIQLYYIDQGPYAWSTNSLTSQ